MSIELIKNEIEESILENFDNQLELARKLQGVYDNRPKPNSFKNCMAGTKFSDGYTEDQIEADKQYVEETLSNIRLNNANEGLEALTNSEVSFQLSEIMQAMIVDRLNENWFKDCKAIMTSEYDDLKSGVDAVFKHKNGGYLGMSFDFTVTNQAKIIHDKLARSWNNIANGRVQTIKYFEDPDTKQKGQLLVPRFIIGASKNDVEQLAKAYLNDDYQTLDNHPFKYLMLMQIEEQLQTALDYFEVNKNDEKLSFAKNKYEKLSNLIRNMKNEIHLDKNIDNEDLYNYTRNSVALDTVRRFRIIKDTKKD